MKRKLVIPCIVMIFIWSLLGCEKNAESSYVDLVGKKFTQEEYKNKVSEVFDNAELQINEVLSRMQQEGDPYSQKEIDAVLLRGYYEGIELELSLITPPKEYEELHDQLIKQLKDGNKHFEYIYRYYEEGNHDYPSNLVDDAIKAYQEANTIRYDIVKKYNSENPPK